MTIADLYKTGRYQTDKGDIKHSFAGQSYIDVYDQIFQKLRGAKFTLFEIGVLFGGSLKLWRDAFPNANIVGLDIDPGAAQFRSEGTTIEIVDQNDEKALLRLASQVSDLKVVIDDGSHFLPHLMTSFEVLFPKMISGGLYIMEDMAISYHGVDGGWPGMKFNVPPLRETNIRASFDQWVLKKIKDMDSCTGCLRSIRFHPMMTVFEKV